VGLVVGLIESDDARIGAKVGSTERAGVINESWVGRNVGDIESILDGDEKDAVEVGSPEYVTEGATVGISRGSKVRLLGDGYSVG